MKIVIACALLMFSAASMADTWVNGYTKRDGTYVQGHYRSSPNSTTYDNYSTKGNTNPYTGEQGYRDPNEGYRNPASAYGGYRGNSAYR